MGLVSYIRIIYLPTYLPTYPSMCGGMDGCGTWLHIGLVDNFQPEGRGFDCRSSRPVGTLGKSLSHSCLWRSGVKLRHSIRAVSGALLSRIRLKEAL